MPAGGEYFKGGTLRNNPSPMKEVYNTRMRRKAQIWDCIEAFGKNYNNHHMYCIIDLEAHINEALLEKAIKKSLPVFPILKSSYKTGIYRAYWSDSGRYDRDFRLMISEENEEEAINSFLKDEIRETSDIQLKAKIVRKKEKDKILIAINHMVCDASDFKRYLYVLSGIYTKLLDNGSYIPKEVYDGSRSSIGVYLSFMKGLKTGKEKLNALFRMQNHASYPLAVKFLDQSIVKPFIVSHSIDKERFLNLKQYGKQQGVTINDIFLASFLRTIRNHLSDPWEEINIPCMVDLRRFLKEDFHSIKNLTSTLVVGMEHDMGKDCHETVQKVHRKVAELLDHFPALDGYLYLILLFKLLPISVVQAFIDRYFKSFPIAFSNLGIIDSKQLKFGELVVENCRMTGSIKQKPCFWLAMSSFDDKVTLTINLEGSREDQSFAERFLQELEGELPA